MMREVPWSASRARLFLSRYAAGLVETATRIELGLARAVQSEDAFRLFLEAGLGLDAGEIEDAAREARVRRCRRCGCTDEDCSGCADRAGVACSWVGEDLCSACEDGSFSDFEVLGERVYFGDASGVDAVFERVPLLPNHGDVEAVDLEVQALPRIYVDFELGRYFYVREEVDARSYFPPRPPTATDVREGKEEARGRVR